MSNSNQVEDDTNFVKKSLNFFLFEIAWRFSRHSTSILLIFPLVAVVGINLSGFFVNYFPAREWTGGCLEPLQGAKNAATLPLARTSLEQGLDCLELVKFPKNETEYQNLQAIAQILNSRSTEPTNLYPVFSGTLEQLKHSSLARLEINQLQGAKKAYSPYFLLTLILSAFIYCIILNVLVVVVAFSRHYVDLR